MKRERRRGGVRWREERENTFSFLSAKATGSGGESEASVSESRAVTLYAPRNAPSANAVYIFYIN